MGGGIGKKKGGGGCPRGGPPGPPPGAGPPRRCLSETPPIAAQTLGRNHRPRKKPRRSDPTSSPPSLSDGRLPQKAFQSQSLNRPKTPYPGSCMRKKAAAIARGGLFPDRSPEGRDEGD